MLKTTLFEKAFRKTLKKSKKSAEEDENTVGGGALGDAAATGHNDITNSDWYAPGTAVIPFVFGAIQTRNSSVKKKRKKKKKKNK